MKLRVDVNGVEVWREAFVAKKCGKQCIFVNGEGMDKRYVREPDGTIGFSLRLMRILKTVKED